jgi:hypothetical protein
MFVHAVYKQATLKGGANRFALKGGDAQRGTLQTFYEGVRPSGASLPVHAAENAFYCELHNNWPFFCI